MNLGICAEREPYGSMDVRRFMRHTHPLPVAAACAALSVALLSGCGSRVQRSETPPEPQVMEFEGIVLEVTGSEDGNPVTTAFDQKELFEKGHAHLQKEEWAEAEQHFAKILEYFPEGRYASAALYNRGLCLEALKRYSEAAALFRRYTQLAKDPEDRLDGEYHWGYNLVQSGDHPTAIQLFDRLLSDAALGARDRAEAHLRRGTAFLALRRNGEAERDFKKALEFVEQATEGFTRGSDIFAEAYFRRGELYQNLFTDVPLRLPVERMRADLKEKVRFFRQSQSSYIDALNAHHPYWATAAGMKLGVLYEEFYRHILQAEVPPGFDKDTQRFYLLELKKQLRPLVEQALTIYEKNITMSQRIGASNEWVEETETRMARLRSLLEETHREAQADASASGGS